MQATVRSFDETTLGGTVLLDDGSELSYTGEALAGGRLLRLRIGQRVAVEVTPRDGGRVVARLHLYTLPGPR